jgi:hypothetical protein
VLLELDLLEMEKLANHLEPWDVMVHIDPNMVRENTKLAKGGPISIKEQ